MAAIPAKRQPLLLITYPRSASNLLVKILNLPEQPQVTSRDSGGYFFFPAAASMNRAGLLRRLPRDWTADEADLLRRRYQACYDELQQLLDEADEQGKMAVTKEHAPFITSPAFVPDFLHGTRDAAAPWRVQVPERAAAATAECPPPGLSGNPSVLPDALLLRCVPAFLIRHPALAFPSWHRVVLSFCDGDAARLEREMVPFAALGCTLRWTRQLYDWYAAASGKEPVILGADDMLRDPEVIRRFCDLVGLDKDKVRFRWEPVTEAEQGRVSAAGAKTRVTLNASSGIAEGKTFEGLSIEGEVEKWKAEFGELVGSRIEGWVRDAMPDYAYLVGKKLQANV
ncbi:hypothetical protein ISF_01983 [Cordyceps fumosorosea ARSEF 2679]|uniref:P-loop containing nucleoside triphosphate hydrolase protein n=1 Tax=Cordyceps fumosorosea (strain ARSEF 2679) TaxID=1081104 RepID=A0A162JND7_CORFA|nr:hypothetical protein ISF_01983 [Cordyceps fumosorosea ARSEF 2679]OAA71432.1 hypothetical protein ISF_01983 [Cordyceps fumosorosea ARSEF 2679]